MLVLTRKINERIQVGNVIITAVKYQNGQMRIGIDAPANVPITRLGPKEGIISGEIQVRNSSGIKVGRATNSNSKKSEGSKKRLSKRK